MPHKKHFGLKIAVVVSLISLIAGCTAKKEKMPSVDIIEKELKEGRLDYDKATLYKVYAIFKHPKLPNKYRSQAITRQGTKTFKEIRRNWDKLSEQTKKEIAPFLNPFKEKGYPQQESKAPSFSLTAQAWADTPPLPNFASLSHYDAANGKVKIWYKASDQQKAQWLIEAFDTHRIYERETALMNRHPKSDSGAVGTDARLDVMFADISDMGLTVPGPVTGHKCYAHIFISRNMTREEVQNSIAHELFHAIQFNIDVDEADWWQEQTATWTEDYIYKDYNIEHNYLKDYFKNFKMRNSLVFENGSFEYGAYVWPLYLAQKHGASIIKKIWDACESSAALTAFVHTIPGGLEKAFKEFSLWVYNQEPSRYFRDIGGGFLPITPSQKDNRIAIDGVINEPVDLDYLSLTIERLYLTAQDKRHIRSIDFDFTDFHNEHPKVAVWAIIKIKDEDEKEEDWSRVDFRNYCFDLADEDLEEITFIFGAACLTPEDAANLVDYTAKEYGCDAKLSLNWSVSSGGEGDWRYSYKNSPGSKASMSGAIRMAESGELSVSFIEHIVDASNPEDPDDGKQLVPYGGFSVRAGNSSKATWFPLEPHGVQGSSFLNCQARDTWSGNERSKNELALLRLDIIAPDTQEDAQISPQDMAMIPQEMQQQLQQLQNMAQSMENQFNNLPNMPAQPQEGELKYKVFLSFGNLPATFTAYLGQGGEIEETTYTPNTIDIEGIFSEQERTVNINKSVQMPGGSGQLSGVLRLKSRE